MAVFSAGHILTAADFDTLFPTGVAAWTAYTPTWTSSGVAPAIGNGSIVGAYAKIGRSTLWRATVTMGASTTYGSGNYFISLPTSAVTVSGLPLCQSIIIDSSVGTRYSRVGHLWTVASAIFASEAGTLVTNLSPMTWASGDTWLIAGAYEAAA